MAKKTTQTLKSEIKLGKFGTIFDLIFVSIYMVIAFTLSFLVDTRMQVYYYIFSFVMAIYLTLKSKLNKGRRNFESIYFLISNDITVYRPIVRGEDELD